MLELLERESPLRAVEDALRAAARRRGSIVSVGGEPGIGKTAFVRCFAERHAEDARVLTGCCDDLTTPRPLGAFRDVADGLSGPLADALRRGTPAETFHTLLLDELRACRAPTVVVLEDVHWADQATMDAVVVAGRRLADLPVLLVLTYRPGEVGPGHLLRTASDSLQRTTRLEIELAPLSREAVATLAGEETDRIYELTGGNPFFVSQMLEHGGAADVGEIPPSLANAVLGRAARLDEPCRQLLELIAMVPTRVSTRILDRLEPAWPAVVEPAERRRLLTSDPRHVGFRHELARAAIRSSVSPGRRRLLHGRILRVLKELDADPADLVHHAEAAGASEIVAEHALTAARQAEAVGSHREALAQYRRAADATGRRGPAEEAALFEGLARCAYLGGCIDEALDAVTRALGLNERRGDRSAVGRCLSFRAHLHWFAGDGDAARHDARAAVATYPSAGPPSELARAHVRSSELAMLSGHGADAVRWSEQALRLTGDEAMRTRARACIGAMRIQIDPDDRVTLTEALEAAQQVGDHHQAVLILVALAVVDLQWVRPGPSRVHAERGRSYALEHEVDTMADYLQAVLAWIHLRGGDRERAERLAFGVLDGRSAADRTVPGMQARTVLVELAVRRGDDDAAASLADLAEDVDRTGELKRIGPVLELQVEQALTSGEALPTGRFREVEERVGSHPLRTGASGGRLAAWAVECGLPNAFAGRAPAPHAAMIAGDRQRAAAAFGAVGWSHDRALMLSFLDDKDALVEALVIARSCGSVPLEQRVSRRMRALGLQVPRGPLVSTRSNPAGLTDRQVEVLMLLAEGCSNATIGDGLFISPRTVEHHVAGIYEKLDVSSRAEAIARCARLGLL